MKKGFKHSEETKAKFRKAKLGKRRPDMIGNKHALGHKDTEETREKKRQMMLSKPVKYWSGKKMTGNRKIGWKMSDESKVNISNGHRGEKHPSWKGGTSRNYYNRIVLERDNYKCQICGLEDHEIMEVDHIVPKAIRPELFSEMTNLMTICPNCHRRKTHRDLKQIIEFKKSLKVTKS